MVCGALGYEKTVRINCITHLLDQIPYEDTISEEIVLEERPAQQGYVGPPMDGQTFVLEVHGEV